LSPIVVYDGPVDSDDPSVAYVLPGDPGEPNVTLPLGQEVEVSADDLKRLKKDEAHNFKTGKQKAEATAPWPDYDDLNADQVIERLDDPNHTPHAEAAQSVLAYEEATEKRKTVLEAASHQVEAFSVNEESA
jgi:hypothetical protein